MTSGDNSFALKIVHKGLAIIIVPFFFNCFWLFILFENLERTSKLIELEHDQSMFLEHLNPVIDCTSETRQCYVGYLLSKKDVFLYRGDQYVERTRTALKELFALPHNTPEQKACARELSELVEGQFSQIRKLIKHPGDQLTLDMLSDIESTRADASNVLAKDLGMENQLLRQRKDLEAARKEAEQNRELVRATVLLGVAGNLLLTISLILFFNKDMSNRLKVLVQNAQKLPKRETLLTPVAGNDELTYLDSILHQASDELQKAFEFRSSLLQMVAHDLRSPLFACRIALDYVFDFDSSNFTDKGRRQLESMRANMDRLVNLINDLLLIEQFENDRLQLDIEPENIKELITQSITSVSALADQKGIKLLNDANTEYVDVDRQRIIQVLVNYLSNAIKFSPKGSEIHVVSKVVFNNLEVSINDQGVGIKPEDAAKLFQKFYQAKDGKAAGGSGLGLAICKLIINSHKGQVGVKSEPNRGSSFWFSLPAGGDSPNG